MRVPACYQAEETASGYRLVLEDLSTWREGADPVWVAALLADLHRRWEHRAEDQWPWLKRSTGAAEAIGRLYDDVWASLRERPDITSAVVDAGRRYVGRVEQLERDEVAFGRLTIIHGDVSSRKRPLVGKGRSSPRRLGGRAARRRRDRPDLVLGLISGTPAVGRGVGRLRSRRG